VEGGDQAGGHIGSRAGTLLQQRKRRWSEQLWFRTGIKRNLELAAMVWVEIKEKSSVFKRDPMTKTWG
jgi:hypothetical protein